MIASTLAAEGASVAGLDLNREGLEESARLVESQGQRALSVTVDLADHRSVQCEVARVIDDFGGVDILVNAAGGGVVSYFHEMTYETWMSQLDRNLNSVFNATRAVLPVMLAQSGGVIVNVSSVATRGINRVPYAAAKGGVNAITACLAFE